MVPCVTFDANELTLLAQKFREAPKLFNQALLATLRRVGANMRKNIRKGVQGASYLKSSDIASAIGRLQLKGITAELTVAGSVLAGHKFRMVPNRITARKGKRSIFWRSPGVAIGPGESVRHPLKPSHFKPFITRIKDGSKVMYWREKGTNQISMPTIAAPQYFAAFDKVKDPVMSEAEATFLKRLTHELDHRLGALR